MSQQSDFYLERANSERALAEASALANVRIGHERAAAAWDALAARSVKADRLRADEELRKAEAKLASDAVPVSAGMDAVLA